MGYHEAARRLRRPLDPDGGVGELVRMATLAANSHNSQPWRFRRLSDGLLVTPDPERRSPAADPDDHHLFVSLGCAVENAVRAGPALGFEVGPEVVEEGVRLHLAPCARTTTNAAAAILKRQCTRGPYARRALAPGTLDALVRTADCGAVVLRLFEGPVGVGAVRAVIVDAVRAQMADAAFRDELFAWIRWTDREALACRDGLSARVLGLLGLPRSLLSAVRTLVLDPDRAARRVSFELDATAAVAVLAGPEASVASWIETGRVFQRLALAATVHDVRHALVNQPLEVASLRPTLAAAAGLGSRRPDLVVRLGEGALRPYSLRRPPAAVLGP